MIVVKKQFDAKGNLVLQAIVEDGKVKSVRCFESNGHELSSDPALFQITANGAIELKSITKMASGIETKTPLHIFSEATFSLKENNENNRQINLYGNIYGTGIGFRATEQTFSNLGTAVAQMSSTANGLMNGMQKVQNAKNALGGNDNAEGTEKSKKD